MHFYTEQDRIHITPTLSYDDNNQRGLRLATRRWISLTCIASSIRAEQVFHDPILPNVPGGVVYDVFRKFLDSRRRCSKIITWRRHHVLSSAKKKSGGKGRLCSKFAMRSMGHCIELTRRLKDGCSKRRSIM
ncbi:uncharacterized protein MYCFIDRAFT_175893 [Pseudocercospora fijiensis CIRAD86]|uniref:Uncharacterized protein n=1 Tax=Pseudocercospora fijiensis (strain CIRAD86) TaxID=383855 RepID=M3AYT4_PSEFD|nr:uncharacterized protein MYCFIDRAFT_175893 [Pseudocercospora fijiensis CIRAD86]EME82357.1 hypothetical protein MYCFIDRAFT_175893 [Pseudocercospora fijiensis CIRAD86]